MTHRMSSSDACSLVIMFGMAMLTMVRSSRVMKNPSDTTSKTAHGFPRYCFTSFLPETAADRQPRSHDVVLNNARHGLRHSAQLLQAQAEPGSVESSTRA